MWSLQNGLWRISGPYVIDQGSQFVIFLLDQPTVLRNSIEGSKMCTLTRACLIFWPHATISKAKWNFNAQFDQLAGFDAKPNWRPNQRFLSADGRTFIKFFL